MRIADLGQLHAARQIGCHDIAAGLVEDGLVDPGFGGAERFPIAKSCVSGANVAVTDKHGLEEYLRPVRIELVLGYDLSPKRRNVVTLIMLLTESAV